MLATCLHFMKGTPYIYQGEELGMTNRKCRDFSEFRDIEIKNAYRDFVGGGILDEETMLKFVNAIGRDNARFPMHWDDSDNAGFTTGTPWISVNENYKKINAAAQVNDPDSIFSYYKKLIELRHTRVRRLNTRMCLRTLEHLEMRNCLWSAISGSRRWILPWKTVLPGTRKS